MPLIITTKRCVANVEAIFQNGKKDNSGSYNAVCFTLVPGKHMTLVLWLTISRPVNNKKKVIGSNQIGFIKDKNSRCHLP